MTYAKAVAETVPDDIMQGRPGETGIPHSDQWLERPKATDGKMWKKNRKSVMIDRNGRGVPTSLAEEMFQARECDGTRFQSREADGSLRAMHEGLYDSGRYCFKFPPVWNQATLNKRIAVRRIDTPANDYLFFLTFQVEYEDVEEETAIQEWVVSVPSNYSIHEALGAIMTQSRKTPWESLPDGKVAPVLYAIYQMYAVEFTFVDQDSDLSFSITATQDFWTMMNVADLTKVGGEGNGTPFAATHKFPNVWDRKTLFLHASFVTDTTAGYLGRGGEFYPKPSKMYRHGNYADFFVETSLDGYHKVPMPYENWIVELSLILDADEYQSP
jgi:hypothetical protein